MYQLQLDQDMALQSEQLKQDIAVHDEKYETKDAKRGVTAKFSEKNGSPDFMDRMKKTLSAVRPDGAEPTFFNQDIVDMDENEASKMHRLASQNEQGHRG